MTNVITKNNEYNLHNLTDLKVTLLSKYDSYRNKMDEIEREIEVEHMLTSLAAGGKMLPRDKLRIKSQLNKISDKQVRFATFNLLSENLRTVIDYGVKARNRSSINWEENLMSGTKRATMLDLQKIATNCAISLKKGHKMKMGEEEYDEPEMGKHKKAHKLSEHEEEYKESEEKLSKKKVKMGEDYEHHEFTKKDLKHCLSYAEDEKKEELSKYLSTFLSRDEEAEEESEKEVAEEEEKEKGKFSKEVKKLNSEYAELKKQNEEILQKIAILSKGTDESKALFNKIVELQTT